MELKDQILARMYVVITLISLLPVLIGLQILRVTTVDGPGLRITGEEQSTETQVLPAFRGEIFDAEGRPLVVNIKRVGVNLDPTVDGFGAHSKLFFEKLSRVSGVSVERLRARVRNSPSPKYARLVKDVRMSEEELIWFADIPGALLDASTTRYYNHGRAAAHVIGVAGDDEGQSGLEKQFDKELRGEDGTRLIHKDREQIAKLIPGSPEKPPVHGESLLLTIDLIKQTILEEELEKGALTARAKSASAVAIDPRTGEILAMANYPSFNPNTVNRSNVGVMRNRAITDKIEPGSVIKVVPAAAAITSGVVAMSDSIDTGDGVLVQGSYTLRDTHPHGMITFLEVLQVSSNVGTAMVAEDIEEGVMYQWARQFGFNQQTGIELPGEARTSLLKVEKWDANTRSAMSRGYAIHATTLQIALAYGALANGGTLMKPYIVSERRAFDGSVTWKAHPDSVRRVMDRETAATLMPAFESVVSEVGTAPLAMVDGLRIAGKTGTARKASTETKGYVAGKYRSTFVGFYPVENPQVVLAIVMDEPETSSYGGVVAGPVFKAVTERWLARMPQIAEYMHFEGREEAPDSAAVVPDMESLPLPIAGKRVAALGLKIPDAGSDYRTAVMAQSLNPGTEALAGVPIQLTAVTDSLETMPDLSGLSSREVMAWMAALNIEVTLQGHGLVKSQSAAPGSALPDQVTLRLN